MATLDGIRAIDFGQYLAGPLAAIMLGDQGAERRFAEEPAAAWVEDLMQDPWVRAHGLSISRTSMLGDMVMPGVAARLSRTPLKVGAAVHPGWRR